MNKIPFFILLLFLPVVLLSCKSNSVKKNNVISGKVIKVVDGDTITILDFQNRQTKIRLYGIDAPEKAQDFGNPSKEYLANLVAGKDIVVTVIDIDRYGRSVGKINDGKEIAEEMLKSGLAWLYTAYCKIPECRQWKELEVQAKTAKIGLWSNPTAQEPWKWRKAQNRNKKPDFKLRFRKVLGLDKNSLPKAPPLHL